MLRGALALLLILPAGLHAAPPVLRNVDLRGLQIGGTTTIVCAGDDFGPAPQLLLTFAAKTELKKGSTPKQATFDVTLDGNVVPGYYHLRLVSDEGVSQPLVIGVDRLAQRPLAPTLDALPQAVHGAVAGSAAAETHFTGKAGQKVMIEIEAQRFGSKLRPVVHLHSPRRLQLAWSWPTPALAGDTRLETTLPDDGAYTIALHDVEYAAAAPSFYRMKVGQWSSVDQVFPPVVAKGQTPTIELLGTGTFPAVKAPGANALGAVPLSWPGAGPWSGPRPFVSVSPHTEMLEGPGKAISGPAGPVGISGRLLTPFEEDRYRVAVTPGTKVRFEVFAERIQSPIDVALVVRNDAGTEVARAEDSRGTLDPMLEYAVPAKVEAVIVGVIDAQGRGGPRGVYRLTVEPAGGAGSDFQLFTPTQELTLPSGGSDVIAVHVERRGYGGPIELAAKPLPPGVRLDNATIPPEADGALVTVQRGAAARPVITTWVGRGAGTEQAVSIKGHPLERLQPWLATEIAMAPTSLKAADFKVEWRDLPADAALVPSKKLVLPVKLTPIPEKTFVKLSLVTSQFTPRVNNQPDPNKALRAEKAVELDAKAKGPELTMLVPTQLSGPVYDVTVQAELLAADKKTVKATAYAPVRRLPVRLPLVVKLDSARLETTLDAKKGAAIKLAGKVERLDGVKGDVALTLTGLPAGAKTDAVNLKGDATAFSFNIVLPPSASPGEFRAQVAGTLAPNPQQPNIRLRSRDAELTLVVKAAPK